MSSSSNNNLFQTYWVPAYRFIIENNIKEFIQLTEKDNYKHINMQRNDGSTLLHIACNSAKDEFIFHLLRNGANANIVNSKGESPMYHLIDTFINSHSNREIELLRNYAKRVRKSLNHFIQYTNKEDLRRIIHTPIYNTQKTLYQRLQLFRNANITSQGKTEINTWLRILYPFVSPHSNSDNNNNNNDGSGSSSKKKRKNNSGASTTTTTTTTTNDVVLEKTLTLDEQLAKQLEDAEKKGEVVDLTKETQQNQQNKQTNITIQDRLRMVSTLTNNLIKSKVKQVLNRISPSIRQFQIQVWNAVKLQYMGSLQEHVIQIENQMFQNATSRNEYIDISTINTRVKKAVEDYKSRKQNSSAFTVKKETNQLIQQIKNLKL